MAIPLTEAVPLSPRHTNLEGILNSKCPVCRMPCHFEQEWLGKTTSQSKVLFSYFCSQCGEYKMDMAWMASLQLRQLNSQQIANASGYLRENQHISLKDRSDIDFLCQVSTPTVTTKAHKLLAAIARLHPIPGTVVEVKYRNCDSQREMFLNQRNGNSSPDPNADRAALELFPTFSYAWAQQESELKFLFLDYLVIEMGYLENVQHNISDPSLQLKITAKGWAHLQASGLSDSSTGFVAMWFDDQMKNVWENGFYSGIKDTGYSAIRIDKKEHNNKIDDEIIASIRGSRFVIADFTGGRGGVYFEAGFAAGLHIPVIWTVREDWLKELHFDTRQFNHISWKDTAIPEFRTTLKNRIEATLGHGPIRN